MEICPQDPQNRQGVCGGNEPNHPGCSLRASPELPGPQSGKDGSEGGRRAGEGGEQYFRELPAKGFNASKSGRFHVRFLSQAAGLIRWMLFPGGRKGPGSGQVIVLRRVVGLKRLLLHRLGNLAKGCAVIRVTLKVSKD